MGTQKHFSMKTTPQWLHVGSCMWWGHIKHKQWNIHLQFFLNSVTILCSSSNLKTHFKKELVVLLLGNWKHNVDYIKGVPHTTWNACVKFRQCTSVSNITLHLLSIYDSSDHLSWRVEVVQSHPHNVGQTLHIPLYTYTACTPMVVTRHPLD